MIVNSAVTFTALVRMVLKYVICIIVHIWSEFMMLKNLRMIAMIDNDKES